MANTIGNLFIAFKAQDGGLLSQLRDVQREVKATQKDFAPLQRALTQTGQAMRSAGIALTAAISLPLAALGGISVKAAMDFESSFAGVRKTVDATEAEFAVLSQGFRNMAKEIPVSVNELNRVGEAAGQLGIKKGDILEFTKTMAMLGETTNLSADQAAVATAQIQNIFGAAGKDVDRFGSTLVALGNAGASTEQDIINMGLRIAGSGHQVGLTQAQVLSFASALSSVGINAEAGGSAISRVFLRINDAVHAGGEKLQGFAKITGISAEKFRQSFQNDAAGATTEFIKGLARIKEEGGNVNAAIEGVVGKNIILKDTLLRAAGAGELLTEQLALGDAAWQKNNALLVEAAERHKTFESLVKILQAKLNDAAISLGNGMIPALKTLIKFIDPAVEMVGKLAEKFAALPFPIQAGIIGFGAFAASIGPVIGIMGLFLGGLGNLLPLFTKVLPYITGTSGMVAAFTKIGVALTGLALPIAATVAALAVLGVAAYAIYKNWDAVSELLKPIWDALQMAATKVWDEIQGGIDEFMKATSRLWKTYGNDVSQIWENMKIAISAVWNVISDIVTAGIRIVSALISAGFKIILGVVEMGLGFLTGDWTLAMHGVETISVAAFELVKSVVMSLFRFTMSEVSRLISTVGAAATGLGESLPGFLGAPLKAIGNTLENSAAGLRNFVTALDEQEAQAYEAGEAAKWFAEQTRSLTDAQKDLGAQETKKWFEGLVPGIDSSKQSAAMFRMETLGAHLEVQKLNGSLDDEEAALKASTKAMDDAKKKAKEFADQQEETRRSLRAPTFIPEYVDAAVKGAWDINVAQTEASQKIQEEYSKERQRVMAVDYALQDTVTNALKKVGDFTVKAEQLRAPFEWIKENPIEVPDTTKEDIAEVLQDSLDLQKATDSIRNSAGHIFDDMFKKGESVFSNLKNALKGGVLSLGRSIFEDVTASLLGPIKKAFDDFFSGLLEGFGFKKFISGLGQQLGSAISKLFGGAGGGGIPGLPGGGSSGILGGLLSKIPGLSGLLGGGASYSASASSAVAASAYGTPGVAGGSAATALLTNPWTIAIGAAILGGVAIVKSQAHHEANKWVQEVQNPFDQAITNIHDAFYSAYASGNLTAEAAEEARRQVTALWQEYMDKANEFASHGSDEAKVIRQAFAEMAKYWGQDLSKITNGFTDAINTLNGTDSKCPGQQDLFKPYTGLVSTPTGNVNWVNGVPADGGFAEGLPYVPMDGYAYLHKGEAVVTAADNRDVPRILEAIYSELRKGHSHDIHIDGKKVATALTAGVRNGGVELVASRSLK